MSIRINKIENVASGPLEIEVEIDAGNARFLGSIQYLAPFRSESREYQALIVRQALTTIGPAFLTEADIAAAIQDYYALAV